MTDKPQEHSYELADGEFCILVQGNRIRLMCADDMDDKPMLPLHRAMVEAVIRCTIEPGFAEDCLRNAEERRKKAN